MIMALWAVPYSDSLRANGADRVIEKTDTVFDGAVSRSSVPSDGKTQRSAFLNIYTSIDGAALRAW